MLRRRLPIVVVLALAATLGLAAAAPAVEEATLSLASAPAAPVVNAVITVTTSGTTSDTSPMWIYYELNATTCAVTQSDEIVRPNVELIDIIYPGAGAFSYNSTFTPKAPGTYHMCAYLYFSRDNQTQPPRTLATLDIPVTGPPVKDADADGKPDATDKCPADADKITDSGCPEPAAPKVTAAVQKVGKGKFKITVTCNQKAQLTATGTVGGIDLKSAAGTGSSAAKTLTMTMTKANLAKLKKLLKKKSATATVTVSAEMADGTESTKRTFKITK
jgi:hypothetical protein